LFESYSADYGFNAVCLDASLYANGRYVTKSWRMIGDGLHNVTRYYGKDLTPSSDQSYRKSSLGTVWRNWHPGPLGFQMAADQFALYHLDALRAAVDILIERGNHSTANDLIWEKDFENFDTPLMADDLIEPLYCPKRICQVQAPPGCLNLEKPTYGYHQVSIVDSEDTLNPKAGEIKDADEGGWTIFTDNHEALKLIPSKERKYEWCQHLDACGGIRASGPENGWVVFKLPKMELGRVIVCGCCGKKVAQDMFLDNEFLEIQVAGETIPREQWSLGPNNKKCAQITEKFPDKIDDSGGHIYLAMRVVDTGVPIPKPKLPSISHIIAM